MSAEFNVRFLRRFQRLLDEGDFSATYKFALLRALADLSVEKPLDPGGTLTISVREIAEKFIEYYWRQARPYRLRDSRCRMQNPHPLALIMIGAQQKTWMAGNVLHAFAARRGLHQRNHLAAEPVHRIARARSDGRPQAIDRSPRRSVVQGHASAYTCRPFHSAFKPNRDVNMPCSAIPWKR